MVRRKIKSNPLYYNLGLAIVWDVFGFVLFLISLLGIGIPISFILDFLAVGSSLLFRYMHKAYFLKVSREIKAEYKAMEKQVKRSRKKAIAQQYAKIRGKMDEWVNKGLSILTKEIIRMLLTFLLELVPFVGDFSPTWTIKALAELNEFGKQKKKYQLLIFQIQAMQALLKVEEKVLPGYSKVKKSVQSVGRIARGDLSEVAERIPGRQQYQNIKRGVQKISRTAQTGVTAAGAALGSVRTSLVTAQASNASYQQRVQRERMIEQQRMRYNESRSSGKAYYNSPSASGSSQMQVAGRMLHNKIDSREEFGAGRESQVERKKSTQVTSEQSKERNTSNQT
jgi:hypothetical protein